MYFIENEECSKILLTDSLCSILFYASRTKCIFLSVLHGAVSALKLIDLGSRVVPYPCGGCKMRNVGKLSAIFALLGLMALAASSQGAVQQNKTCSNFGPGNGARYPYCVGFSCRNNTSPVYCGSSYTNSVEAVESGYNICTDFTYSQCNEIGNVVCVTFKRSESLGCGDWFPCNSYVYVTGCNT